MRTITLLWLFIATAAFAQEEETDKIKFNWYYGVGISGNNGFNINSNLRDAGVKRIPDVLPTVVLGWDATFTNRLSLAMEFGASGFFRKKSDGSQLVQVPFRLRMQYLVFDKEKFSVGAGVNLSMVGNDLSVWDDGTTIDMDNLDPGVNTGYIRLRNTSYFAGPSATVKLKDEEGTFLILAMGYDFGLSNSKWKSDYVKLSGTVKEQNDQFFVNLCIPF